MNDEPDTKLNRPLRRTEAADYVRDRHGLPCSPLTLAKLACIGGGPVFRKGGRFPLYSMADLDEWASSKIGPRVRSTSELASRSGEAA